MYGTTMKNYNTNKVFKSKEKKNSEGFSKKKSRNAQVANESKKVQDTKYMKLEETSAYSNGKNYGAHRGSFSIKEFPIASVILTVLFTMMVMIATGIAGV